MSRRIDESDAVRFFEERDGFLIFTHNSPDADTIGSALALVLALRFRGKRAVAFNREGIPARLSFLRQEGFLIPFLPADLSGYTLVSVDVASPKMLSGGDENLTFALSVDHHEINTISCERLYLSQTRRSARRSDAVRLRPSVCSA